MKKTTLWNTKSEIKSFYFDTRFTSLDDFSKLILSNLNFGNTYSLLIRIEYNDGKFGMLGPQMGFKLDYNSYLLLLNILHKKILSRLEDFSDYYKVESIDSLQLLFVEVNIIPKLMLQNINYINLKDKGVNVKDVKQKYKSNFLPLTTNTNYFGKLVSNELFMTLINRINEQNILLSKVCIDSNEIENMFIYNGYIILNKIVRNNIFVRDIYDLESGFYEATFIDTIINDNNFIRQYKNISFTISNNIINDLTINNELAIVKKDHNKSYHKKDGLVSNPYIGVFDLEAFRSQDGFAKPYAVGFCILNEKPITFYLDNNKKDDILLKCLDYMLQPKYDNYLFYIHNLNYDGIFIINKLKNINMIKGFEYYKVKSFFRENSILKIDVSITRELQAKKQPITGVRKKPHDIKITFVDSSNLLKGKLSYLCKSFDLEVGKGYFPHSFVNLDNLNYIGCTPAYYYWNDTPLSEYNKLVKLDWNLKEECLFYLNKDLTSLLEIMNLFNKYVTRKFDVQMTDSLTISRLSLNIFLKHYLNESKIPLIKENIYNDLKQAYYGGVTEVYKPHGTNLFYYDVNSLYPYVSLNPMCGNKYSYIESLDNTTLNLDNLFGFFYCEIKCSENYLGLLPIRRLEGLVLPNGEWSGWYFSEELKLAKENGYNIKVLKGYNFEKQYNVFDNYVKTLYEIKSTTKNTVEKSISKSLLNNLLGRFGLNIHKPTTEIVNKDILDMLLSTRECNSFKKITEDDYLISYYPKVSKSICESHGYDYIKVLQEFSSNYNKDIEFKDVSLVISSAVTSYARIYMSKIKLDILKKGGNIYYTDTDSIVTDIKLDSHLIGKDLGQFKLEYEIREAFFISSKTYLLILKDHSSVIKTKGLLNESLTIEDFYYLYEGYNVKGFKRSATSNYEKGSVIIDDKSTWLNHDSYKKRTKILDKNGKWVDTKPIYLTKDLKDNSNNISKKKLSKSNTSFNKSISHNLHKDFNFTNILNFSFKFFKKIGEWTLSLFIVCLLGYSIDTNELDSLNVIDSSNVINYNNHKNSWDKTYFNTKSTFEKYSHKNNYNETYINSIYNDIIQSIISHNIINQNKLLNINSLIFYTENYINKQIENGDYKITTSEYFKLLSKINDIQNNPKLLNYICKNKQKNLLDKSTENISSINKSIKYNKVCKKYLEKYNNWVTNPYTNTIPEEMVIKNKLSLLEELELVNNNYTHIINDINKIILNIDTNLNNHIPRKAV